LFLEDFLEICANIYSKKLLVVAKESENIQPGDAKLKSKGAKHANVPICIWCLYTRVNVPRYDTQPVLAYLMNILQIQKFQLESS
jgi:hypothetical protein